MAFFVQLAISYGVAILLGTVVLTKGSGDGFATIASVYGLIGLPFGLVAGALCRLFERFIGVPGPALALGLLMGLLYWIAPNKQNASAGALLIVPYVIVFAAAWTFLSWRYRSA